METYKDINLFNKNIKSLKKYMNKVHLFFSRYEPKRYFLIQEEHGLNIYDKELNQKTYKKDSFLYGENQAKEYLKNPKIINYNQEKLQENHNHRFFHSYLLELIKKNGAPKKTSYKTDNDSKGYTDISFIPCMIIFGSGLGYHINYLCENSTITNLFIYEPEPDIFYASLHSIDWGKILERFSEKRKNITIQIGINSGEFINNISIYFSKNGHFSATKNHIYKHYSSQEIIDSIDKFYSIIHRMFQGWGFYEDELLGFSHTLNILAKKGRLILEKNSFNTNNIKNAPILILANGPSLDTDLQWIKENKNKFIIFSCGSTLKSLYKNGITPDFHIESERTKDVYNWIIDINDASYLKKIYLLSFNNIYPDSVDFFKGFIYGLKSNDTGAKFIIRSLSMINPGIIVNCNPTVTNAALALASYLGFKDIYFFGVDMGFKNNQNHHSLHSAYYEKNSLFYKEKIESQIKVLGNFNEEIITTLELDYSRYYIERHLKDFPEISAKNCSDGAKIAFAEPIKSENINIKQYEDLKKDEIFQEIINYYSIDTPKNIQKNIENKFFMHFMQIEQVIFKIKDELEKKPNNIEDLHYLFFDQFQAVNDLLESGNIASLMLIGSIDYIQTIIYINMLSIDNKIDFEVKIGCFFNIAIKYFDNILSITKKHYKTKEGDFNISEYCKL